MADHINFHVSATPVEELTDENSNTKKVIAGEIGTALGGGGDSSDLTNYSGTAANQGYKDAAVNYLDCTHAAGGTALSATDEPDFIFIKNTGYKFSSTTVLGAVTTDCVMVTVKEVAWSTGAQGGYSTSGDSGQIHFYEIGWLKPGQAMVLPLGAAANSITAFGDNANDLQPLDQDDNNEGGSSLVLKTFLSNGSAASDGNAVEYLFVK